MAELGTNKLNYLYLYLGVGNINYKKHIYYTSPAGEVYDNIPVAYGLTIIVEANGTGSAALFTVGYNQGYTHLISDTGSLIGNYFNVEHGTNNGPHIKITLLRATSVYVIALG